MTWKHKLKPAFSQKLTTGQWKTSKKHVTSMSWRQSPRNSHVTLVSRYPVLTAVNWP